MLLLVKSAKYGLDPDPVPDQNFSKVLSGINSFGSTTLLWTFDILHFRNQAQHQTRGSLIRYLIFTFTCPVTLSPMLNETHITMEGKQKEYTVPNLSVVFF